MYRRNPKKPSQTKSCCRRCGGSKRMTCRRCCGVMTVDLLCLVCWDTGNPGHLGPVLHYNYDSKSYWQPQWIRCPQKCNNEVLEVQCQECDGDGKVLCDSC